jgi:hypothetical protein
MSSLRQRYIWFRQQWQRVSSSQECQFWFGMRETDEDSCRSKWWNEASTRNGLWKVWQLQYQHIHSDTSTDQGNFIDPILKTASRCAFFPWGWDVGRTPKIHTFSSDPSLLLLPLLLASTTSNSPIRCLSRARGKSYRIETTPDSISPADLARQRRERFGFSERDIFRRLRNTLFWYCI